jgi:hypothetical protein
MVRDNGQCVAGLRLRHVGVEWRAARQGRMAGIDINPEITRCRHLCSSIWRLRQKRSSISVGPIPSGK